MSHRKHHYIPQFYLRPWLGTDHKLEEFGRVPPSNQIRSRRRGTESTGYEIDLYTIPGATEETKQNIERVFMGLVDSTAAEARNMLIRGVIPEGKQRFAWARFLMSLGIRTPIEIREFKQKVERDWYQQDPHVHAQYLGIRKPEWPATLEEYLTNSDSTVVERTAINLMATLIENENVTRLLAGAMWWVLDTSKVSRRLMTSDHPLIMTNGLGRNDGHFALSISPTKLFIGFMKPEFSQAFRRMPIGKIVRLTNEAVIGQARKNVYGVTGENIAEVRRGMGKRDYMSFVSLL